MTAAIRHPFKHSALNYARISAAVCLRRRRRALLEAKSEEAARSIMVAGYNVVGLGKVDEVLTVLAPNIAGEGSAVRIGGVIYDGEIYSASEK